MSSDRLFDVIVSAERLSVSRATVYRLISGPTPAIRTVHIGRRHLIPESEINRYIADAIAAGRK